MKRFEIIVKVNGTNYYLDTTDSDGISINYSISDIVDISTRNASFTKTITLPETKNNREVFGFISDLSSDGTLFNPNKKVEAYVLVDSIIVFEGYLQLKNIKPNFDKNEKFYECVIYASNFTFFNLISNKYISDINFTEYDHTYSTASVINSWKSYSNSGYFYGLKDTGNNWYWEDINGRTPTNQLKLKDWKPDVYVKTIWDKIFSGSGYTYNSSFLNSQKFKNLLMPFNNSVVPTSKTFIYDNSFAAGRSTAASYSVTALISSYNFDNPSTDLLFNTRFNYQIDFNKTTTPYSNPNSGYIGNSTWINNTSLNLSTGFVIDLDIFAQWAPPIASDSLVDLNSNNFSGVGFGSQFGSDMEDSIRIYRSLNPFNGWIDPDFDNQFYGSADSDYYADTTPITSYPSFYQNSTGVCKTIDLSAGLFDNAQITIDQSLASNLTWIVEYSTAGSGGPWFSAPITKTNGATAMSISTAGQLVIGAQDYYYRSSSLGLINPTHIRVRITSRTSGELKGYIRRTAANRLPRYLCPIFQGNTKLNLWAGQAEITPGGTYSSGGFSQSNTNFRLTRYTTDLLNNTIVSATVSNIYARPTEKFKMVYSRVIVGKPKTSGATPPPTPPSLGLNYANITTTIGTSSYWALNIDQEAFPGVDIDFNSIVPRKAKQTDFILSIMRMFNLYFEPSKDVTNQLNIEPREDYYLNGEIKDWTDKIDLNVEISEQVIAETQNKFTNFTYKSDSDFYNSDYTSKTSNIFGSYDYIMDNDFIKGTKKVELLFSPTPITNMPNAYGIIIPRIFKTKDGNAGNLSYEHYDFNYRILSRSNEGLISTGGSTIKFEGMSMSTYPYIGHLDHPIYPTYDLNFGEMTNIYDGGAFGWDRYLIPLVNDNLFNTYYSKMMDEYSNPASRIVTLSLYLNPVDINNFRFNDSIYLNIDGSGQYYKVLKIDGYDPTQPGKTCKVQLLKTVYITVPKNINADNGSIDMGGSGIVPNQTPPIYIPPYPTNGFISGNNNGSRTKSTLILGSNNFSGNSGTIVGDNNINGGVNTSIQGNYNSVQSSNNLVVAGDGNSIDQVTTGGLIIGGGNQMVDGGGVIFGNNNIVTGTNSFVIGNNIVATESNIVYIGGSGSNIIISGTISQENIKVGLNEIAFGTGTGITSSEYFKVNLGVNATLEFGYGNSFTTPNVYSSVIGSSNTIEDTSNNLIVGANITNKFSQNTIISGYNNKLYTSINSSIIGGVDNNLLNSNNSSIINGKGNQIKKSSSAPGPQSSTIIGGIENIIDNSLAGGGDGIYSSNIIGGFKNLIDSSHFSTIIGGASNSSFGYNGGTFNGYRSLIAGGFNNKTQYGDDSSIIGGNSNHLYNSNSSIILSGSSNYLGGSNTSFIIGGDHNNITYGINNSIVGGNANTISINSINSSIISSSASSIITSTNSVIIGGSTNFMGTSSNSSIVGGFSNKLNGINSNILGSYNSLIIEGRYSSIVSGYKNEIINDHPSYFESRKNNIIGGELNKIKSTLYNTYTQEIKNSLIIGGDNNTIDCEATEASGGGSHNINSIIIGGKGSSIGAYAPGSGGVFLNNIKNTIIISASGSSAGGVLDNGVILGGNKNYLNGGNNNAIISGYRNSIEQISKFGIISGSDTSRIISSKQSSIISSHRSILTNSNKTSIIGGSTHSTFYSNNSVIIGGEVNSLYKSGNSIILGGINNRVESNPTTDGLNSSIINGINNKIGYNAYNSSIMGGSSNYIKATSESSIIGGFSNSIILSYGYSRNTIVGGSSNQINNDANNAIVLGGYSNTVSKSGSSVLGGQYNNVQSGQSSIVGGYNNTISQVAGNSAIIGGNHNIITTTVGSISNSLILGGNNLSLTASNTVLVPNLKINNLTTAADDIEITDYTKGIILRDSVGGRWRVTVNTSGVLVVTSV